MKSKIAALLLPALLPCLVCHSEEQANQVGTQPSALLSKITSSDLSGASARFSGSQLVVDNMRIMSATTEGSDYVRGTFQFSNSSESFTPTNYQVFPGVGVFNTSNYEAFFASDSTSPITLKNKAGALFSENQTYDAVSSNSPYTATLNLGQVISFNVYNISDDLHCVVTAPDGSTPYTSYLSAGANIITGSIPILQTGLYTFSFAKVSTTPVTYTMTFSNANRQKLESVVNGDYLSTDLNYNLRDYYKYRIHLNAGDKLELDAPNSVDTHMVLLNSKSAAVSNDTGLGILYIASVTGTYYLFISDDHAAGSDYSGYVHITSSSTSSVNESAARPETKLPPYIMNGTTPGKLR